ncbi:ash family protein [Serratia sp. CY81684]
MLTGAYAALAVFLCAEHSYTSMVGCVGHPQGWPVSCKPGSLNPIQLTTS